MAHEIIETLCQIADNPSPDRICHGSDDICPCGCICNSGWQWCTRQHNSLPVLWKDNAPLTVQFTDQSLSIGKTSYAWDIDNDGIVDYTNKHPSHTYHEAGNLYRYTYGNQ